LSNLQPDVQAVYDALRAPMLIDVYGNLYALQADGATLSVPRPSGDGEVCYFRPGRSERGAWVCSNKTIYGLLADGTPLQVALAQTALPYSKLLVNYSPVFPVHDPQRRSEVIGISSAGSAVTATLEKDGVLAVVASGVYCTAGWRSADTISLVGMTERDGDNDGHTRSQSVALNVATTGGAGRVTNLEPLALSADEVSRHLPRYPVGRRTAVAVECWLSALLLDDGIPLLIAGLHDRGLPDDPWLFGRSPDNTDFATVGAYRLLSGRAELACLWYPYRFFQVVQAKGVSLVYLTRWERSKGHTVDALRVAKFSSTALPTELHEVRMLDIDRSLNLNFLDLHYDPRVGFYGCVFLQRKLFDCVSYLVMSDDGVTWRNVHELQISRSNSSSAS
jgi:hypothetical protein